MTKYADERIEFLINVPKEKILIKKLILISKREYYIKNTDIIQHGACYEGIIKGLDFDKNEILNKFTLLDFLINDAICLKYFNLQDFNKKEYDILNNMIEKINFSYKIKILLDMDYITKGISKNLNQIKDIRNYYSHQHIGDPTYYQIDLEDNFKKFKSDLEEIFNIFEIINKKERNLQTLKLIILE